MGVGQQPGRPDGETEMTTLTAPYSPSYNTYSTADDDTVRLPLPAHPTADPRPVEHRSAEYRTTDRRPVLDATRLWTGGLATAAVAALVGLVGTLVIRVLFHYAPVGTAAAHAFTTTNAGLLCLFAAVAALAATGIAHLLTVSTPDPLSYLGWIIGLSTAAAVVVPLLGGLPMAAAIAVAVVNLVIGLAIGSLVVGAAAAAYRPTAR
jgi:hypothetical protein